MRKKKMNDNQLLPVWQEISNDNPFYYSYYENYNNKVIEIHKLEYKTNGQSLLVKVWRYEVVC